MIGRVLRDWSEIRGLPRIKINLALDETSNNEPFFRRVVEEFYTNATRRHRRIPFFRELEIGVAVNCLPGTYDEYFMDIDGSARRNVKKARRLGYDFERIDYSSHLDDIWDIHRSTPVRQGPMSKEFLDQRPEPIADPQSGTNVHDYPYFGVTKNGRVVAYGGCFVAGELMMITTIFGHEGCKSNGVVPLLIVGMAEYSYEAYPRVKYYGYDKYYGADVGLRRFKKKFGFAPHVVTWTL